jgi:hypothetical protein
MEILRLMSLEFVQNVPLIAGFLLAFPFWKQGEWAAAMACMLAGSVLGALAIRITEPKMVEGHRETTRTAIGNASAFCALMLVLTLYLAAGWSTWWMDIVAGWLVALALALAQELANEARLGLVRSLWLGLSCAVGLILIRSLMAYSILVTTLIVAAWVTLVMGTSYLKDYGINLISLGRSKL